MATTRTPEENPVAGRPLALLAKKILGHVDRGEEGRELPPVENRREPRPRLPDSLRPGLEDDGRVDAGGARLGPDVPNGVRRCGIAELLRRVEGAPLRRLGRGGTSGRGILRDGVNEGHDARPARVDEDLPFRLLLGLVVPHDPVRQRELALREPPERLRSALLDDVPRGVVREAGDAALVLGLRRAHGLVLREARPRVADAAPGVGIDAVDLEEAPRHGLGLRAPRGVLRVRLHAVAGNDERRSEDERDDTHPGQGTGRERGNAGLARRVRRRGRGRGRHETEVPVGQAPRGQEAAPPSAQHERDGQRQQQDPRGDRPGDDVVRVARTQQEERRVDRVHREVPDQERHHAVAQHQESDQDAGEPHLEAPDVEGLVRVRRVPEAPDEGGHDDRHEPSRAELVEEGDREHPADPLLGDGRQEPDQEHRRPREGRVEHVAVRDVGRRPRAEVPGHDVEDRLVGEEERRQRIAEDDALQEALRLDPPEREGAAERDLLAGSARGRWARPPRRRARSRRRCRSRRGSRG